ncbi:hypothetical protein [Microvirga vignae]|uniref:hypothetical protein n=1 Tax=Microvirga vignae TaxID=1225564 RepID=UPI000A629A05|nr:hypothetical protein [Microvirga vignae]
MRTLCSPLALALCVGLAFLFYGRDGAWGAVLGWALYPACRGILMAALAQIRGR